MAEWIPLFLDVKQNPEFKAYEEEMRSGKKGRRARRTAENVAWAQVADLYLMLGMTKDGRIDMKSTGSRLLAEECMRESGAELEAIFGRMASCGVINGELWESGRVVTTTVAVQLAERRKKYKDRSAAANEAKRRKARASAQDEPTR